MRRVLHCLLTLLLLAASPGTASDPADFPVREPVLAGTWYPASPGDLDEMTSAFLAQAQPPAISGRVVGLLAPHAGYIYSGQTAAYGFKLLEGAHFDTVVLVGPSHYLSFDGVAAYDQGDFKTPFGVAPLDRQTIAALIAKDPLIRPLPQAHEKEHSLEIELPLLQAAMSDFKIVPLIMGRQDAQTCGRLAVALAAVLKGKSVLLVASSDLSHFHEVNAAKKLDAVFAADVAAFDADKLLGDLEAGRCEACGGGPTAAVMLAAKALGATTATILAQSTSADVTGDNSRVVGYLSAAFTTGDATGTAVPDKAESAAPTPDKAALATSFSESERSELRAIARNAIQAALEHKIFARPNELSPALNQKRGAFVTLTIRGELRGCIGMIETDQPLHETVAAMARQAAFHDPRFPALTAGEFKDVDIEISVLTTPRRISDPGEVEVGRDGLIVRRFPNSGLLLPQVARQYGWDRETFLGQTCRKAGLPDACWKDKNTEISVFSAEAF